MTSWRSNCTGLILAAGMLLLASGCCARAPTENELKVIIDREGYDRLREWFEREGGATEEVLCASQSNYYFDFLDEENGRLLLKRKGVNCRLRTKEQAAIFTVKVGEPIDVEALTLLELKTLLELAALDSLAKKPEYQCSLALGVETARSILAGTLHFLSDDVNCEESTDPSPSSFLKQILDSGLVTAGGDRVFPQSEELVVVGSSETLRSKIPVSLGGVDIVLELDRTRFPKSFVGYEIEVEIERSEDRHRIEDGLMQLLKRLNVRGIPASSIGKTTTTLLILYGKRETVKGLEKCGLIHRQPAGVKTSRLSLYTQRHRGSTTNRTHCGVRSLSRRFFVPRRRWKSVAGYWARRIVTTSKASVTWQGYTKSWENFLAQKPATRSLRGTQNFTAPRPTSGATGCCATSRCY